mmetsp:Transcript_40280/g.103110  ORF Transcript_40280/g.103110 Transcript_40280/m.103110 type:complete len:300 (+) Transcript_40280:93-992(+)
MNRRGLSSKSNAFPGGRESCLGNGHHALAVGLGVPGWIDLLSPRSGEDLGFKGHPGLLEPPAAEPVRSARCQQDQVVVPLFPRLLLNVVEQAVPAPPVAVAGVHTKRRHLGALHAGRVGAQILQLSTREDLRIAYHNCVVIDLLHDFLRAAVDNNAGGHERLQQLDDALNVLERGWLDAFVKIGRHHGANPIPGVQLQQQPTINRGVHQVRPLHSVGAGSHGGDDLHGHAVRPPLVQVPGPGDVIFRRQLGVAWGLAHNIRVVQLLLSHPGQDAGELQHFLLRISQRHPPGKVELLNGV